MITLLSAVQPRGTPLARRAQRQRRTCSSPIHGKTDYARSGSRFISPRILHAGLPVGFMPCARRPRRSVRRAGGGTGPSNISQLATVNGTPNGTTVQVQIDSSSPLAAVGGAALVRSSSGLLLVARTGDQAFTALTSTCTHQTCTISGFDGTDYVCPCHGSRFTTSGRVVNGPAAAPLRTFNTVFANNVLTIG